MTNRCVQSCKNQLKQSAICCGIVLDDMVGKYGCPNCEGENMREDYDIDARKDAARRGHHSCIKCGGMYTTHEVDGSKCGGIAGITYKVCNSCGYTVAKTKRQRKFKL